MTKGQQSEARQFNFLDWFEENVKTNIRPTNWTRFILILVPSVVLFFVIIGIFAVPYYYIFQEVPEKNFFVRLMLAGLIEIVFAMGVGLILVVIGVVLAVAGFVSLTVYLKLNELLSRDSDNSLKPNTLN